MHKQCLDCNHQDCLLRQVAVGDIDADADRICKVCECPLDQLDLDIEQIGEKIAKVVHREQSATNVAVAAAIERARQLRTSKTDDTKPPNQHQAPRRNTTQGLAEGFQIGDYEIIREIGRGGMGVVYEARQTSLDRIVALKTLPQHLFANEKSVARFRREARSASQLHHTNIVPIFEVGEENGILFYSMQLIDGVGLDSFVQSPTGQTAQVAVSTDRDLSQTKPYATETAERRAGMRRHGDPGTSYHTGQDYRPNSKHTVLAGIQRHRFLADVGRQIAFALDHAHQRGVIHRDIKPSNLLLDTENVAWLADFGLAKQIDDELTGTMDAPGTLRFMSPERFQGECDARSDVYSLGVTLYELLVRKPIFESTDHLSLMRQIVATEPPQLREFDKTIPHDLQTIVNKATSKDVALRYATARELGEDLRRFLSGEAILARRVGPVEKLTMWARKNTGLAASLSAVLLLLIVGGVVATVAALQFRDLAMKESTLREDANRVAEERTRDLYFSEMQQAIDATKSARGIRHLRKLLARWIPGDESFTDYRDWEWYWLNGRAEQASVVINHSDPSVVWTARFSPDDQFVCWAHKNTVYVADWPELSTVRTLAGSSAWPMSVQFSPSGDRLAVGGTDNSVRIWDWKNESVIHNIEFENDEIVFAVAWHPTEEFLAFQSGYRNAAGIYQTNAYVYRCDNWQQIAKIENRHSDYIRNIGFSPDGARLALASKSGGSGKRTGQSGVRLFDTEYWRQTSEKVINDYPTTCLDWHLSSNRIATCSADKTVKIWNLEDDSVRVIGESMYLTSVQWHPQGQQLAYSGRDFGVSLWNESEQFLQVLLGHQHQVFALDWSARGDVILSADEEGEIRFWRANETPPIRTLKNFCNWYFFDPLARITWSPNDALLSTVNGSAVTIWNVQTGERVCASAETEVPVQTSGEQLTVPKDKYTIPGELADWNSTGESLVVNDDNSLTVYNADGTKRIGQIGLDTAERTLMDTLNLNEGTALALFTDDKCWDLESVNVNSGERHSIVNEEPMRDPARQKFTKMTCSPDGRFITIATAVLGSKAGYLYVIDLRESKITRKVQLDEVMTWSTEWSPDSNWLAIGMGNQSIAIYETEQWQKTMTLDGHVAAVRALSWHPNGRRLASGSEDKTVRIWDTQSGNSVMTIPRDSEVRSVEFSHCGEQLATMGKNGIVQIYDAGIGYRRDASAPKSRQVSTDYESFQVRVYDGIARETSYVGSNGP